MWKSVIFTVFTYFYNFIQKRAKKPRGNQGPYSLYSLLASIVNVMNKMPFFYLKINKWPLLWLYSWFYCFLLNCFQLQKVVLLSKGAKMTGTGLNKASKLVGHLGIEFTDFNSASPLDFFWGLTRKTHSLARGVFTREEIYCEKSTPFYCHKKWHFFDFWPLFLFVRKPQYFSFGRKSPYATFRSTFPSYLVLSRYFWCFCSLHLRSKID